MALILTVSVGDVWKPKFKYTLLPVGLEKVDNVESTVRDTKEEIEHLRKQLHDLSFKRIENLEARVNQIEKENESLRKQLKSADDLFKFFKKSKSLSLKSNGSGDVEVGYYAQARATPDRFHGVVVNRQTPQQSQVRVIPPRAIKRGNDLHMSHSDAFEVQILPFIWEENVTSEVSATHFRLSSDRQQIQVLIAGMYQVFLKQTISNGIPIVLQLNGEEIVNSVDIQELIKCNRGDVLQVIDKQQQQRERGFSIFQEENVFCFTILFLGD